MWLHTIVLSAYCIGLLLADSFIQLGIRDSIQRLGLDTLLFKKKKNDTLSNFIRSKAFP